MKSEYRIHLCIRTFMLKHVSCYFNLRLGMS